MQGQFQLCCSAPWPSQQARHVYCLHSGINTPATGRRRRCSAASGLLANRAEAAFSEAAQTARSLTTDTPAAAAAAEAAAASTRQRSTSRASQPHRLYDDQALYLEQPMLLTAHIKKCASWQQLRQLLQRAGAAVNHIHLSAAATHCAQQQQQQQHQELGSDDCAAWVLALVQQLLVQHSASVQPRQLANTLWALARCCQQVPREPLEQLLLLQQQQMEQQLQQAPQQQQQQQHARQPRATGAGSCWHKPQDLSHSLWALATLQHQPTPAWQASFWELSGQLLPGFSLQQLSNTVWAAARLQLQVPQPWLQQLLAAAAAHMQQLAAGGATPHQQLPAPNRPSGGSSSSSSVNSAVAAGQAHSLALIAHGLARLDCRPCAAWLAAFYSASRPLLPAASPGQLSMLLWSLAVWQEGPVPSDWLQAFAAALQPQLPAASNQGVVNTAASCYQLLLALRSSRGKQQQQQQQVQELQQLLAAILAEAANRVDSLAVSDAAALTWAAAGFSCRDVSPAAVAGAATCDSLEQPEPGQQQQLGWLHSFVALHTSSAAGGVQQADGSSCSELLLLLWLCAKGGVLPSSTQWCAAACSAVTAQLEQASPGELARLSWTLGQLLKVPGTTQHTGAHTREQQGHHGQPMRAVQSPVANSISSRSSDGDPTQLQAAELAGPLLSLAAQLLQRMPQAMPAMSQLELLESAAGAASMAGAQAAHSEQQQPEWEGQPVNLALLVEAAAFAACGHVSSMSGAQLLLLARSLLQLLQHMQAAGGGESNSRERLRQPLLHLLRAAAEQLSALPPAAAVSCGLSFLAVGVAASAPKPAEAAGSQTRPVLPAAASFTDAAAGSSSSAATEARCHHGSHLLRVSSARPVLGCQPLQERLLAVVAGSVHRLEPAELLAATQLTQRLRLAMPGNATAELLYALQLQVIRAAFTPEQLLALLVLLQHWRGVPRSAAAARASLVGGWLRATHRLMQQQLEQLQLEDGLAASALGLAAGSPANRTGDGDTAAAAAVPALLAGVALGLARLHLQPPEPWLGCYCRLLQLALRLGLPSSDELSRVLLGLAGLGFRPDDQTVAALLAASGTQLPGMNRSELVRVIHSLGKLGIAPGEAWLQRFYERVATAPGSFGLSGFGMLVWALARLGAAPPQAWLQQLLDSSFGAAGSRGSQQQGGQQMRRLQPQHMANIICAFAKLRFSPGERWLAWFRAELGQAAGPGGLLELDHFHIEWAWRELHEQYQAAAAGSGGEGQTAAAGGSAGTGA